MRLEETEGKVEAAHKAIKTRPAIQRLKTTVVAFLAWLLVHLLFGTTRKRVVGLKSVRELLASGRPVILLSWHGTLMLCAYAARSFQVTALVSPSRDGDFLAATFRLFGWSVRRGSTAREGASGSLGIIRDVRQGQVLAWVADGPRGPAGELKPGILRLAAMIGAVIIPIGAAARPAIRLNTWDRHLVPWPLSRAAICFGEPIELPRRMDDVELNDMAQSVKDALNEAKRRAKELLD